MECQGHLACRLYFVQRKQVDGRPPSALLSSPRMQTPTCKNVRIRSIQDVHKIFAAVQRGWLKMITRRLDADERMALRSGCIYVWEERGPNTEVTGLGMERFTEGRRWSPSRVRDDFLFYFEQYSGGDGSDSQPPREWDPLIKQTYSALVQTDRGTRKWHLTAYYTENTMDHLGNIDDLDRIKDIVVPDGVYVSQKTAKSKKDKGQKKKTTVTRKYAGYPPSTNVPQEQSSSQSVHMFDPYSQRPDAGPSSALQPAYIQQPSAHAHYGSHDMPPYLPSAPSSHSPYLSPGGYPSPGSSSSSASSRSSVHSPMMYPSDRPVYTTSSSWYTGLPPEPYHSTPAYHPHHVHPHEPSTSSTTLYPPPHSYDHDQMYATDEYEAPPSPVSEEEQGSTKRGPSRDLAPLHLLKRTHPYRRDPMDDKALRKLDPRLSAGGGPPETP